MGCRRPSSPRHSKRGASGFACNRNAANIPMSRHIDRVAACCHRETLLTGVAILMLSGRAHNATTNFKPGRPFGYSETTRGVGVPFKNFDAITPPLIRGSSAFHRGGCDEQGLCFALMRFAQLRGHAANAALSTRVRTVPNRPSIIDGPGGAMLWWWCARRR